jgi:hypothetical protein
MAAELITPTDELSGLPLPLLPVAEKLPLKGGEANWHHHFHPASSPVLTESNGGRALRSSRIQLVPRTHHNYGNKTAYHAFYAGPPIPSERDEQVGMAVLSCAGYIPEYAIDVSTGDPHIDHLTRRQTKMLTMKSDPVRVGDNEVKHYLETRDPEATYDEAHKLLQQKRIRQASLSYRNIRYSYDPMKNFFAEVVLEQDLSHMRRMSAIGKFLLDGDVTQGLSALFQAATQAVNEAAYRGQTVAQVYEQARELGRLHPYVPLKAGRLVYNKLGDFEGRSRFLPMLRSKLLGMDSFAA